MKAEGWMEGQDGRTDGWSDRWTADGLWWWVGGGMKEWMMDGWVVDS